MSYALTRTRSSEKGVPASTLAATSLVSHQPEKTVIRLGLAITALACCLIALTTDARARQAAPDELAYCARLSALYGRYHFNLYHMDGTWAPAELARLDCVHGNVDRGTRDLERILQDDRFVLPQDRSPTYQGFAQP